MASRNFCLMVQSFSLLDNWPQILDWIRVSWVTRAVQDTNPLLLDQNRSPLMCARVQGLAVTSPIRLEKSSPSLGPFFSAICQSHHSDNRVLWSNTVVAETSSAHISRCLMSWLMWHFFFGIQLISELVGPEPGNGFHHWLTPFSSPDVQSLYFKAHWYRYFFAAVRSWFFSQVFWLYGRLHWGCCIS